MTERVQAAGLQVAKELYDFVNEKSIPGTGVDQEAFWSSFSAIANELAPRNRELLAKRDDIQAKIDAFHTERKGQDFDFAEYKAFLQEIGYLVEEGADFDALSSFLVQEGADDQAVNHIMANWVLDEAMSSYDKARKAAARRAADRNAKRRRGEMRHALCY